MSKSVVEYSIEKYKKLANKFNYKYFGKHYQEQMNVECEDPYTGDKWVEQLNAELTIFIDYTTNKGERTFKKYKKAELRLINKIYKKFGYDTYVYSILIDPNETIDDDLNF